MLDDWEDIERFAWVDEVLELMISSPRDNEQSFMA